MVETKRMKLKNFIDWIANNKELVGIIVPVIVAVPVWSIIKNLCYAVHCLITFLFRLKTDESTKKAYKKIENAVESKKKNILSEPMFFDELDKKKYFFYNGFTIEDLCNKQKRIKVKKLIHKSYLLVGEAGSGKSACLKNDFLNLRNKRVLHTRFAQWFLHSNELTKLLDDRDKQNHKIDLLLQAKYKKLYLYIDGLDEIGENRVPLFFDFINKLALDEGIDFVLKITSRSQFAINNISSENSTHIKNFLKVSDWNEKNLLGYCKQIIRHLTQQKYLTLRKSQDCYNIIKNSKMRKKYITNPLLMKLYIYCCIHGSITDIENNIENRFNFYSTFITILLKNYWRRKNSPQSMEFLFKQQNDFAEQVFKSINRSGKVINNVEYSLGLLPLCKKTSDNNAVLIHESFYEYFVARYYYNCTTSINPSVDNVFVYCCNYSNDYADFITDAFKKDNEETRKRIAQRFFEIYFFTLNRQGKRKYNELGFSGPSFSLNLSNLGGHEFFSLKYELIFRLGRLQSNEEIIAKFLDFIYCYDNNTGITNENKYYITFLKRCCAISSSFIGGEKIEIDYVKHMLPYDKDNYDEKYDLANRTHTLLFYGDVTGSNIFNFIDDDPNQCCDKAFKKRIDRLSFHLPKDVVTMDEKSRKKYYFRLFDLATIYTFMKSRNIKLKQGELDIVQKCEVDFEGASEERTALMKIIKNHILLLCE